MKRTLFAAAAVVAAGLAAAYLVGADGTNTTHTGTTTGTQTHKPMTDAQQVMQAPALETVECTEGYILLMPCPICHTCPVCQANCGTAHALKCCLGNKTPAYNASTGAATGAATGASTSMTQQHIMTNKAEAVKHAAGRPATAPQMQTDTATMSVIEIESN